MTPPFELSTEGEEQCADRESDERGTQIVSLAAQFLEAENGLAMWSFDNTREQARPRVDATPVLAAGRIVRAGDTLGWRLPTSHARGAVRLQRAV